MEETDLPADSIVYERSNTWIALDSGTTSGSRQTLITGEACMRACRELMKELNAGKTLADVKGQVFTENILQKQILLEQMFPTLYPMLPMDMQLRCVSSIRKQERLKKWLQPMMLERQSIHCPAKVR